MGLVLEIKGIDISNYQPEINLENFKNEGCSVVYIKATEGLSYKDPLVQKNYEKAKLANVNIGFYHFLHPKDNGTKQAQFILTNISGFKYNCKIAIDIEVTDNQNNSTINKCINDFAVEIKRQTGNNPIIYTYLSFKNSYLNSSLAKYGLWLADYGVNTLVLDDIWRENLLGWQYTDSGGMDKSIDLDRFNEKILISNMLSYKVGDTVRVKSSAKMYVTGQRIPEFVKESNYTVQEIINDKVLLHEIQSWVYICDLRILTNIFEVGDIVRVKLSAKTYVTGQRIPEFVKESNYTVQEIINDKVLLHEIQSWVYICDIFKLFK